MNLPEPGIYKGIPEYTYRLWPAVNQSTLWTLRRSPAHAHYEFHHPSSTSSTDIGQSIHALLLEGPEALEASFAVRPPGIDRRTREGKVEWAAFEAESAGKVILDDPKTYDLLQGARDSLLRHPLALKLLTGPGMTEVSCVWVDPETGITCKSRMDRIVEHEDWTWIVDLKTTGRDASPRAFANSVMNFGYHVQAAFYRDGLDVLSPRDRRFGFVVMEKDPPFEIKCYELDLVFDELGREEYRQYLRTWKHCTETGNWPGYPDELETLTAPQWVERRLSDRGVA